MHKALSLHGSEGRTKLRDQIIAVYGRLLDTHPSMAEPIARDLIAWNRSDLADRLQALEGMPAGHNREQASRSERSVSVVGSIK